MHARVKPRPSPPAAAPAAAPPRGRRKRGSGRPVANHLVMPGREIGRAEPRAGETISAFLRRVEWARHHRGRGWEFTRTRLPTIVIVNGRTVLRRHWTRCRIRSGDQVALVSWPLGGRGGTAKQAIGLAALLAISALSLGIASGGIAALGIVGGTWQAYGAAAAAGVLGSMGVNAIVGVRPSGSNAPGSSGDQLYSASITNNISTLNSPLQVGYGRTRRVLPLGASTWFETIGNDQWINFTLDLGLGSYSHESIYSGKTIFWTAADGIASQFLDPAATSDGNDGTISGAPPTAQLQFLEPGERVTLFPPAVYQSTDLAATSLPSGTGSTSKGTGVPGDPLGPFVGQPSGKSARSVVFDWMCPTGAYFQDNKARYKPVKIRLIATRAPVNDAGAVIGDWQTLFDLTRSYNSREPLRDSQRVDLAEAGQYTYRLQRGDAKSDGSVDSDGNTTINDVYWTGLRSYLVDDGTSPVPPTSRIAGRMKASQATQSGLQFAYLGTRKLQVWDADAGEFTLQPTRNIFWAYLDALQAEYGGEKSLSQIDIDTIIAAAAASDARGEHFDYVFTSRGTLLDAFATILAPARSAPCWIGSTVSCFRDEWRDVPTMMITDREIIRGSVVESFSMLGANDPDAMQLDYIDEDTWAPAQVQYPPDSESFTATRPGALKLNGVCNRDHAFRETAYHYLDALYRRRKLQIDSEYEGRAITRGSVIRVQTELPQTYGWSGAVVGRAGNVLTLNPAPTWTPDINHFIRLRRANGKDFGPIAVTRGADDSICTLDADDLATIEGQQGLTLDDVLARADGADFPSFSFGGSDNQDKLCLVVTGQPNGDLCRLFLLIDDERVHSTDLGDAPVLPSPTQPANDDIPVISGLTVTLGQGIAEPTLTASWIPPQGAVSYEGDVSYDDGASWTPVLRAATNRLSATVQYADLTLRVRAIGANGPGPYATASLIATQPVVAGGAVALTSLQDALQARATTDIATLRSIIDYVSARLDAMASDAQALAWLQKDQVQSQMQLSADGLSASIKEVKTVALGIGSALSDFQVATEAELEDHASELALNATATSELQSQVNDSSTGLPSKASAAAVTAIQTAIDNPSTGLSANATAISNLATEVNDGSTGLPSKASSAAVTAIQSAIDDPSTGLEATAEATDALYTQVNDPSTGIGPALTALNAQVNDSTTGLPTLYGQINTDDTGIAARLGTVETTQGNHTSTLNLLYSSVGGTSVYAGLVGTIDGVSGGLYLTGFLVDGVTSYSLILDGDVIATGTFSGAKIIAGTVTGVEIAATTVDTVNLKINSVGIDQVIAGAMSNVQALATTAMSNIASETSLGSFAVDIRKSGKAIVIYQLPSPDANGDYYLRLYVDGVAKNQNHWAGASPLSDNWYAPLVAMEYVTGLSDGNHTFDLRGRGKQLYAGVMLVINPRN